MKAALCVAVLVLTACSATPRLPDTGPASHSSYQQRSAELRLLGAWDLVGKLSMDDGAEGGSGRLHWWTRDQSSHMDFRGAMGRGAWRLHIEPGAALLERGDGTRATAATVGELIEQEIGWQVPVRSLQWWVLGLAAPGAYQSMALDADGLVSRLEQDGWVIDFLSYQAVDGRRMPRKMEAVNGRFRVKLAVSRWVLKSREEGG